MHHHLKKEGAISTLFWFFVMILGILVMAL